MDDTYQTLAGPTEGFFRDRGSKFHAYAFSVADRSEVNNQLEVVRQLHPKARHWCYAFRLGLDGNDYRANDDGEPSGTAGRPILGRIDSAGVTNVLVVVVRYFGGTLLGAGGLINAYKTAAADALDGAPVVEKVIKERIALTFDYKFMSEAMNAVKRLSVEVVQQSFTDHGALVIAVPRSEVAETIVQLKAAIAGLHLEEARTTEVVEGLVIDRMN